jgi:hypothetical protein
MDDDGAVGVGVGDRRERLPEFLAVALEELDVGPGVVVRDVVGRQMRVELLDVLRVCGTEHRHVDDLDIDVARLILGELLGKAQIDDALHTVAGERTPALVGEPANVVGANDPAEPGTSAVLGGKTAKVANVDAAFPGE